MTLETKRAALYRRGWVVATRVPNLGPCWEWAGTVMKNGYGYCHADNKLYRAHRVAYEVFVGPIPDGLVVRHRCNNRRCVRPEHLLVGTQQENLDDMKQAKRSAAGSRNARAILTDAQVIEIRRAYAEDGATYKQLAARFGRHWRTISLIIRRISWPAPIQPTEAQA